MPKYLVSYRKTEESGQKPEWASFTTQDERALDPRAIRERVDRRLRVLGETLWGNAETVQVEGGRLDSVLFRRDEAAPETSVIYGIIEE